MGEKETAEVSLNDVTSVYRVSFEGRGAGTVEASLNNLHSTQL
jgi:hypothetical protein